MSKLYYQEILGIISNILSNFIEKSLKSFNKLSLQLHVSDELYVFRVGV